MYHPEKAEFLEATRLAGADIRPDAPLASMASAWHSENFEAFNDGYSAGVVLGLLYAFDRSGWQLPRPASLTMAYRSAEAWGKDTLKMRGKRAHTDPIRAHVSHGTFERCFKDWQSVAHLWAAVFLHSAGFMGSREYEAALSTSGQDGAKRMAHPALAGNA
jgi:hypothetical protein